MNKEELVKAVAQKTSLSQKEVKTCLDGIIAVVTDSLKKGDKVTLVGFGSFLVKQRAEREGRNPQTGKPIKIPAKKVPVFSAGKLLKTEVAAEKKEKKQVKTKK